MVKTAKLNKENLAAHIEQRAELYQLGDLSQLIAERRTPEK